MIPKKLNFDDNKEELIQPALPGVPISFFVSRFSPETYDCVSWHWHNAFQYALVTEGEVDFFLSGQKHTVREGDGIFINYRQMHYSRGHKKNEVSEYACFDMPPSLISADEHSPIFLKYVKPVLEKPYPPCLVLSKEDFGDKGLLEAIASVKDILLNGGDMPELAVTAKMIEIWSLTIPKLKGGLHGTDDCLSTESDRLRAIFTYIGEHYRERICLEDIASLVSLSREECSRFFRKHAGQSLFGYITSFRLNKSIELLRDSDMSIADVASAVGFDSQSYYTSRFRELKGITPKKFKALSKRSSSEPIVKSVF